MKAIISERYGPPDLLKLQEVAKPTPKDNEVLVKVHATSVNWNSTAMATGKPFIARLFTGSLTKPKYRILGNDFAGIVEAIGKNVTCFKPGDAVYGDSSADGFGTFAEYVAVPEKAVGMKPVNVSYEEAAVVPESALVALQALRDHGEIQPGQQVLIVGASGGIGSFAVQLAKYFGAEVTSVCSTRNLEMVRSIGADYVIDYTQEDFAHNGHQYDLIVSTGGYRRLADYKRALKPGGIYVTTGGDMRQIFEPMLLGPFTASDGKRLKNMAVKVNQDLDFMKQVIEDDAVVPVIDSCFPLAETAEAIRHYKQGHVRGKIAISMMH